MPAITAIAISAAAPVGRALAAFGSRMRRHLKQLAKRVTNRRDAMRLAGLDDRMLADIGLTRSDLRDAYAGPLWRNPTDVLALRSAEWRASRRYCAAVERPLSVVAARQARCQPPLDRSPRYLI